MSEREREARLRRLEALREAGVDPYPARVEARIAVAEVVRRYGDQGEEELEAAPETRISSRQIERIWWEQCRRCGLVAGGGRVGWGRGGGVIPHVSGSEPPGSSFANESCHCDIRWRDMVTPRVGGATARTESAAATEVDLVST